MKQIQKHVNFYKLSLMQGCYTGMNKTQEHTLKLAGMSGSYITRMFDTGDRECTYGRLVIDGQFEGAKLEVIVAATDDTDVFIDDIPQSLEHYFKNPNVEHTKKAQALQHLGHVRYVNTQDILLSKLKGRYVWVYIALYPATVCQCELVGMRLELPHYSFSEYFPEIYQENDVFERYVAIFQSLFLDIEKKVDEIPRLLDYRITPQENVEYLASWLGIQNQRHLFSPEQMRYLIANIDIFQGSKGTKYALEEIVLLLCGVRPKIVEHFQWQKTTFSPTQLERNNNLYGETGNHFCVILDLTHVKIAITESELAQCIERYSPLGTQFKIVMLKNTNHTDTHCYLDINSVLSTPEIAGLDGGAFGAHIMVG